jgi:outer membrane protein TolC
MPLGNRQAEGAYRQAVMQRLRAIGSRRDRELTIAQEVYNAVDHLEGSWLVMTAAAEAKFESEKSFDAARELFKRGMQSSLDVAVALDNLGTARLSHLRATVDYQMQLVRLAAATGTVLGRANIEIDPFDPGTDESLEGTLRAAERSTTSPLIQPPAATLPAPLTPTDPK